MKANTLQLNCIEIHCNSLEKLEDNCRYMRKFIATVPVILNMLMLLLFKFWMLSSPIPIIFPTIRHSVWRNCQCVLTVCSHVCLCVCVLIYVRVCVRFYIREANYRFHWIQILHQCELAGTVQCAEAATLQRKWRSPPQSTIAHRNALHQ